MISAYEPDDICQHVINNENCAIKKCISSDGKLLFGYINIWHSVLTDFRIRDPILRKKLYRNCKTCIRNKLTPKERNYIKHTHLNSTFDNRFTEHPKDDYGQWVKDIIYT